MVRRTNSIAKGLGRLGTLRGNIKSPRRTVRKTAGGKKPYPYANRRY